MKRYLKKDNFQLSDHEKENLWLKVKDGAGSGEKSTWSRRFLRPTLGLTTASVVCMLMFTFWLQKEDMSVLFSNLTTKDSGACIQELEKQNVSFKMADEGATIMVPEDEVFRLRVEMANKKVITDSDGEFDLFDGKNYGLTEMAAVADIRRSTAVSKVESQSKSSDDWAVVVDTIPDPQQKPEETVTIAGRIFEKETGDPLAYANVLIEGTNQGMTTDKNGHFELNQLAPGEEVKLRVEYMGYGDEVASFKAEAGKNPMVQIGMQPIVVATLQTFDVAAAVDMVEVKSASSETVITTETFEKFAIDSVEGALSKSAGVISRAGEQRTSGGRITTSESAIRMVAPVPPMQPFGSVTGGTTAPNGEPHELMYFDHTGVNPFVATEDDSLSTFAVDVDNASYTVARRYINGGSLPPKDAIRVEEFVNFFNAGYRKQSEETFAINLDGAPSRFGDGYQMVRVGLQGKVIPDENRKSANLVFLVDISGSMDMDNRLGMVKSSLRIMLEELREGDRVGIVVYGNRAEVRLQPTDIGRRDVILSAIDGLRTNGATNAYAGLQLAYLMARENYQFHKLNRVILCSDGVANMGSTTRAEEMLEQIRRASDKGITLSTIGFGMGNYNDVLMEKLADQGDGNYYYVDKKDEAERVFRENLTGLLQTIAREVKIQVAFDDSKVKRWRLLGYENRDVADRDFRNDDVDAGEVGAGHQVTALYEIKLADDATEGRLGTVYLRYEMPAHDDENAGQVREISRDLSMDLLDSKFHKTSARYRLQVLVTEFAEILRGSYWAKESGLKDLVPLADGLAEELSGDEQVQELAGLIRKAADLQSE